MGDLLQPDPSAISAATRRTSIPQQHPISINILRANNLKGSKPDTISTLVRIDWGDKTLGESAKVDSVPLEESAEYNFICSLSVPPEDPVHVDELASRPVVVTVIEVLPKEKKQKEEKTVALGQATFSLFAILKGETRIDLNLDILSTPGSSLDSIPADHAKAIELQHNGQQPDQPSLELFVSCEDPLFNEQQIQANNLASVTVESMFAPPDSWQVSGQQYLYTAAMPLPLTSEKTNALIFTGGILRPGVEKEPPLKRKKWSYPGKAEANAVFIPNCEIASSTVENEDGDLREREHRAHRQQAELERNRVTWNVQRDCFVNQPATHSLQDQIAKHRYWPVEVMRCQLPAQAKKGRGDDDLPMSFHGIAYVNMAPLLYPGVKKIRGAYKVEPYYEAAMTEKTGFKSSLASEASRFVSRHLASPAPKGKTKGGDKEMPALKEKKDETAEPGQLRRLTSRMGGRRGGRGGSKRQFSSRLLTVDDDEEQQDEAIFLRENGPSAQPQDEDTKSLGGAAVTVTFSQTVLGGGGNKHRRKAGAAKTLNEQGEEVNVEGEAYRDAMSYVMVEIELFRPLVRKRQPEELAAKVAEYIPPRPAYPRRSDGAKKAVDDYHSQIASVAALVLDEFRRLFEEELDDPDNPKISEALEDRKSRLLFELNSSGKYFAFKEQLKHSVVKIVREKFFRTKPFDTDQELQAFLSDLYTYLIDEMHISLASVLDVHNPPPVPEPIYDVEQLKLFADEAEACDNIDLASKYYQERIVRTKSLDSNCWIDYGVFNLNIGDLTKAEQCFREAVSIQQDSVAGLLLCGIASALQERNEQAESFIEAATSYDPTSIIAWTIFGLFYESIANEIGSEMAFLEANRLNAAAVEADAKAARASVATLPDAAAAEPQSGSFDRKESSSSHGHVHAPTPPSDKRAGKKHSEKGAAATVKGKAQGGGGGKRQGQTTTPAATSQATDRDDDGATDHHGETSPAASTATIFLRTAKWLADRKAVQVFRG